MLVVFSSSMVQYRQELENFLASPILMVRRLAAQSIIATIADVDEMIGLLQSYVSRLHQSNCTNYIHGCLIVIKQLVLKLENMGDR